MQIHLRLSLFILSLSVLILSSCQPHRDASIENFGELDSSIVATDTTMQVNMDRSYEYQKSLPESDSVVYDFLAYDKPKGSSSPEWESKFIVIRRTSAAHDTIIKDLRSGIVKSIWICDLDHDKRSEIMFYENPKYNDRSAGSYFKLFAYETDGNKKANKVETDMKDDRQHYAGRDTFFIADDHLIRRYPYYKHPGDTMSSESQWQSYTLNDKRLVLSKEKKVPQ